MREKTITNDDLARKILGAYLSQSLDEIDLEDQWDSMPTLAISESATSSITLDDLAKRYLSSTICQALKKSEENTDEVGLGLEIKEIRIYVRGRGLTFLKILVFIAALALGADQALQIVQVLLAK